MKKIISLIIVCLCFFSLISCESSDENESFDLDLDTSSAQISYDFGGKAFTIICMEREGRLEINPFEESEDSAWQERLRNRYVEIEKAVNIDFVFTTQTISLFQAYAAGLEWGDLVDKRIDNHLSDLRAGLYNSLNYVPGFMETLYSGKWGTEAQVEYLNINGEYYGFYPGYHGLPFPAFGGLLYCNNTLLAQYGIRPMEMIENGTWTWSEFEKILETVGGVPSKDGTCGMFIDSYNPAYFLTSLILSNGGSLVTRDSDGRLVSNLGSKEAMEAYDFASGLTTKGLLTEYSTDEKYPMFYDNRLAFIFEYSYCGTVDKDGFMYHDVDFSILPCPCGPSGTYGDWSGYYGLADRYLCVPITADMDIVDAILADLYEPLGEEPYEWRDYYTSQNFLYTDSANMFWTLYDNAEPDYFEATSRFPYREVIMGTKSAAEAIESTADSIQAVLDTYFNSNYN